MARNRGSPGWLLPALAAGVLLASGGCRGGGDGARALPDRPPGEPPPRTMEEIRWERVFRIGGRPGDTLLFGLPRIAADSTGVSAVDRHAGRVLRFDRSGGVRWSFGRAGGGPHEFRHPRDVHVDGQGRTWVLDAANARLTVLGPDGVAAFLVPLDRLGFVPDRFVPLPGDEVLLLDPRAERPWIRVDRRGRVVGRRDLPWRRFRELDPLAAQMHLTPVGDAGGWVAAFAFGDRFLAFDADGRLAHQGWFPETIPFPAVRVHSSGSPLGRQSTSRKLLDPTFAAVGLTRSRDRLYVHFAGRSELAYRLLDSFDLRDGAYLGSVRLPRPVARVALGGDLLYVAYADPYPTLAAWRPTRGRLP